MCDGGSSQAPTERHQLYTTRRDGEERQSEAQRSRAKVVRRKNEKENVKEASLLEILVSPLPRRRQLAGRSCPRIYLKCLNELYLGEVLFNDQSALPLDYDDDTVDGVGRGE